MLMFAAGGIIWLNVINRNGTFGFPINSAEAIPGPGQIFEEHIRIGNVRIAILHSLWNLGFAIAMLSVLGALLEWRLRRRAKSAAKSATPPPPATPP